MATYHGKDGLIKIGSNTIAEVISFTITTAVQTADDTSQLDEWDTHLVGRKNWSAQIEARYYPGDATGQAALEEGDQPTLIFYPSGDATGLQSLTGEATITGNVISSSKDDPVGISFEVLGNGALTRGTAS